MIAVPPRKITSALGVVDGRIGSAGHSERGALIRTSFTGRAIDGAGGSSPMAGGKRVLDRLFGLRTPASCGQYAFDLLCRDLGIEHRLTPSQHSQTYGIVAQVNGRIEVVLRSHYFRSGEKLKTMRHRHAALGNPPLPRSAPGSNMPLQSMKVWHKPKLDLFRKPPFQLSGCEM